MKKERRHELQKNELALWVGRSVDRVKPYGRVIGLGLLLVVIVGIGLWWWNSRSTQEEAERQDVVMGLSDPLQEQQELTMRALQEIPNFETANTDPRRLTPQEFSQVQSDFAQLRLKLDDERLESLETQARTGGDGSLARRLAALAAGDTYLTKGTQLVFEQEREQAIEQLDLAIKHFEDVVENSGGDDEMLIRERASWSLAAAFQARGHEGDVEKARAQLKDLADGAYYRGAAAKVLELFDKNPEFFAMFEQITAPVSAPKGDDDDDDSPFRDSSGNLLGPGGSGERGAGKSGGTSVDSFGKDALNPGK